jgi:hypothetical protein
LAAGNFNGDFTNSFVPIDDLAIGVPGEDLNVQNAGNRLNVGAVNVLFGSLDRLTAANNQFLSQDTTGLASGDAVAEVTDAFGSALAAGNFNGDGRPIGNVERGLAFIGIDDLAVGVPGENVGGIIDAGAVNLFTGSTNGVFAPSALGLITQDSANVPDDAAAGDGFGSTVVMADFDHDLRDDLAIGVPGQDFDPIFDANGNLLSQTDNAGAVNVIYGTVENVPGADSQLWHQDTVEVNGIETTDTARIGNQFGGVLLASRHAPPPSSGAGLFGVWQELTQKCSPSKPECKLRGTIDVFNPGTEPASTTVLQFFLSADEILDSEDLWLQEVRVGRLQPGQTRTETVHAVVQGEATGLFGIAVLDANDDVAEVREDNNIVVSPPIP